MLPWHLSLLSLQKTELLLCCYEGVFPSHYHLYAGHEKPLSYARYMTNVHKAHGLQSMWVFGPWDPVLSAGTAQVLTVNTQSQH